MYAQLIFAGEAACSSIIYGGSNGSKSVIIDGKLSVAIIAISGIVNADRFCFGL